MSLWKFFFLDGFAALISVPVWIWVGFVFGSNLEALGDKIKQFQWGIYIILLVLLVGLFFFYKLKSKLNQRLESYKTNYWNFTSKISRLGSFLRNK